MKIFIVGKHSSGKHQALEVCAQQGVRVGREFSNIPQAPSQVYMDPKYQLYTADDIEKIFEMGAYICVTGIEEDGVMDGYMYHRGLSYYTFDNSDVMVLTPSQFENLNSKAINEKVIFVWLDNTQDNRIRRHAQENRKYTFKEQEEIEERHEIDFVKNLYGFPNSSVIYFTNEDPDRVGTIISAIVKHPDLVEDFIKNFN